MKQLLLAAMLLCIAFVKAQTLTNYSYERFQSQLISPNIDLLNTSGSLITSLEGESLLNFNDLRGNVNIYIPGTKDSFTLGTSFSKIDTYRGFSFYLAKELTDRWRSSIIVDIYEVNERIASSGGFSLSYHHDNGYFGTTIRDVFDTAYQDGSKQDFDQFEAITLQAFALQKIGTLLSFDINAIGIISYHPFDLWNYRIGMEGGFDNNYIGMVHTTNTGWVYYANIDLRIIQAFGSYENDRFHVGVKFQIDGL